MRISDWSSDVCSSDLVEAAVLMLGAGDDAELIEDTVIALILVAFGAAAADEGGCGVGIGRVIVAVDVGDRDRPAVAEPADIRVDHGNIGSGAWRERRSQAVLISGVPGTLKKTATIVPISG